MLSPSRSPALRSRYESIAFVLLVSILVATGGPFALRLQAAQLQLFSDTLSTSKPGIGADHTIRFSTPSGVAADGSTIVVTLPSGFDMSTIGEDDIDIEDDGVDLTTAQSCGAVQAGVSTSTQTITIEICSGGGGAIAASSIVTLKVGTHASDSGSGSRQIINHATAGSYTLSITGTMQDEGYTELVIVESVTVSGQVETYLDFEVFGVDAGETVNADPVPTFSTTTATSVAFGTVAPGTEYLLAQDVAVTTNAGSGFTVTVEANGDLASLSGATIDSFTDGTATGTPINWVEPSGLSGQPDTYGHWGLTTEDITLTDNDSFGDAKYVGDFILSPREIMYSTTSADGATPHVGLTRVGYKLEITTMQEAATDDRTSLTYVVTPVF